MAANINDKFSDVSTGVRPTTTTAASIRSVSGTSLVCDDLTGWATDTAVHFVTYEVDGQGGVVPGTQTDMKGIVSGNTIGNIVITGGTDAGNKVGDIVQALPTAAWAKDLADGVQVSHNQDGSLKGAAIVSGIADGTLPGAKLEDGAVTNAKLGTGAVTYGKTDGAIWWEEIGRTTLGTAGDVITVSSLPARKYLRVIITLLDTGGTINGSVTFNADTGNNYSIRSSSESAADASATSATAFSVVSATLDSTYLAEFDALNISNVEKIITGHSIGDNAAGAANVPRRREFATKWANTSAQISSITVTNTGTGDYAIGSEVIVLGHD